MPPPAPPPKPFDPELERSPPVTGLMGAGGRAATARGLLALLEVMRVGDFVIAFTLRGLVFCRSLVLRSPPLPPPAPVENESGSRLAAVVTVATTQKAASRMSSRCTASETVRPSPPIRSQNPRRALAVSTGGTDGSSWVLSWGSDMGKVLSSFME
ncbi:MAG: hypothetical protein ACKOQ9_01135 [Verrucomicrobiota bacterium]